MAEQIRGTTAQAAQNRSARPRVRKITNFQLAAFVARGMAEDIASVFHAKNNVSSGRRTGIALAAGAVVLGTVASQLPKATPAQIFKTFANTPKAVRSVGSFREPIPEPPLLARLLGIEPAYAAEALVTADQLKREGIILSNDFSSMVFAGRIGLAVAPLSSDHNILFGTDLITHEGFPFILPEVTRIKDTRNVVITGTVLQDKPTFYVMERGSANYVRLQIVGSKNHVGVLAPRDDAALFCTLDGELKHVNEKTGLNLRGVDNPSIAAVKDDLLITGAMPYLFIRHSNGTTSYLPLSNVLKNEGITNLNTTFIMNATTISNSQNYLVLLLPVGGKNLYVFTYNSSTGKADAQIQPFAEHNGGPVELGDKIYVGRNGRYSVVENHGPNVLVYGSTEGYITTLSKESLQAYKP